MEGIIRTVIEWAALTISIPERFFTEPEDRALAHVSDFQGVGGKPGRNPFTLPSTLSPGGEGRGEGVNRPVKEATPP